MKKIILIVAIAIIVFGCYATYQLQKDDAQLAQIKAEKYQSTSHWEPLVEEYLLSQKDFVWRTEENSKTACVFEKLEENEDLFPMALWVYCQEYKIDNGNIKELSGSSIPVLLNYPKHISNLHISHFTHETPGDGSLYSQGIKKIFSKKAQKEIFSHSLENGLKNKMKEKIMLLDDSILPVVSPTGIQLPDNVISEKDCVAQGGEVWNTLGETSYDGKLIGRVDGLKCPCACLVK